jgi:hypothetical protein
MGTFAAIEQHAVLDGLDKSLAGDGIELAVGHPRTLQAPEFENKTGTCGEMHGRRGPATVIEILWNVHFFFTFSLISCEVGPEWRRQERL